MATRPRSSRSGETPAEPDPAPEQPEPAPTPPEVEDVAGPERPAEPMTSVEFDRLRRVLRRKYH
jgi:hypothetical protein